MTTRLTALMFALPVTATLGGCGCNGDNQKSMTVEDARGIVGSKFPGSPVAHTKTTDGDVMSSAKFEFHVNYRTGTDVSVRPDGGLSIRGPVPLELVPERFQSDAKIVLKCEELTQAAMNQNDQLLDLSHEAAYTLTAKPDGKSEATVGFASNGRIVAAGGVPYPWDMVTPALIADADKKYHAVPFRRVATWNAARWSRHPQTLVSKAGDRLTLLGTSATGAQVSAEIGIEERSREELGLLPLAP